MSHFHSQPDCELPTTKDGLVSFIYGVRNLADAQVRAEILWQALHEWFMASRPTPSDGAREAVGYRYVWPDGAVSWFSSRPENAVGWEPVYTAQPPRPSCGVQSRDDVIEECAKTAEGPIYKEHYRGRPGHNWWHQKQRSNDAQYGNGRHDAAAAIRALSSPLSSADRQTITRRSEGDAYFKILQTIARFPITDPKNMDAVNMRLIAEGALALTSTHRGSGE